jgi:type I restriction enzyme, S subunit
MTSTTSELAQQRLSATPELRFPEFRDAPSWDGKELSSIADPVSERADNEGQHNILTLSGEHGLVLQSEYFGKQIAGTSSERYLRIQRDDFVYNDRTTKASAYGTIKRLKHHPHGIVSPIYKCFRFKGGELPSFWEWYFESGAHEAQLRSLANEGARAGRFNVSIDRFLSTIAFSPDPQSSEQAKIAECLSTLDELIDAERQKLDALKTQKQGLVQEFFPRKGEAAPRRRFPEFRSGPEWTTKLGGELFVNRKEAGETGLPIYSVTKHEGMVPRASFDRDFYDIEDPAGNRKVCKGDIAYNMMRMWQGAQGVAPEDCLVSPAYVVLAPQEGVCAEFFAYYFKLPQTLELLTATSRGLTKDRLRLYFDDFARMRMCVPEFAEQQRIAACLASLDALIAAQVRKVEILTTHKQGLMQQLFPSPIEAEG